MKLRASFYVYIRQWTLFPTIFKKKHLVLLLWQHFAMRDSCLRMKPVQRCKQRGRDYNETELECSGIPDRGTEQVQRPRRTVHDMFKEASVVGAE